MPQPTTSTIPTPPPSIPMATLSPSPIAEDDDIPTATLALPSTAATSRRIPPPCWSPEETVALIDAYRDKWYSLRRGNLRANHWQEVADDVASRYLTDPPKTPVQCRHKMEKLRKRYRGEIRRASAHGRVVRYASSWAHFAMMHAMERGPNPSPVSSSGEEEDGGRKNNSSTNRAPSVRIKIPGRSPNPRFSNFVPNGCKFSRDGGFHGEIPKDKDSGVGELVAAIHSLGEGFMRMEKVKMDMARQVEEMRMDTELKRTELMLESERMVFEAFAEAFTERSGKRAKRNSPDPDLNLARSV